MNLTSFLVLLIISYTRTDPTTLLLKIIRMVFPKDKTVCYIHDRPSFEHILDHSLLLANKAILSFQMNQLKNITKDAFCNDYILGLENLTVFEDYIQNKDKYTFYFKPHRRILLIFDQGSKETPLLQYIANLYALDVITVSNLRWEKGNLENKHLLVHSVYKNKTLLEWDYISQPVLGKNKFAPFRWVPRFNFNEEQFAFRISLFDCPPFIILGNDGRIEGSEFKFIEEVVKAWPVQYDMATSKGMWFLIWKVMEDNSSDVAACSMWQSASVGKKVDFTYPFRQTCVSFLVPKPQLLPDSTFVFQPFQDLVWHSITVIIFLVTIVLYMLKRFHENSSIDFYTQIVEIHIQILRMVSVGSIKYFASLRFSSVRILVMSWILTSIIITTYYQAGLTSNLTKPRYTNLVNSLKDMVDQKVIWLSPTKFFQKHLESSGTEVFMKLAALYENGDLVDLKENKAILVKTLENIFVCDIENLSQEKRRPLRVLGECFGRYYTGYVLQKNSPFTRIFNRYSHMYNEYGLLQYWYKLSIKEFKAQRILFQTYLQEERALINLSKLKGSFYLIMITYSVSLVVFLLEIIFHKWYCSGTARMHAPPS